MIATKQAVNSSTNIKRNGGDKFYGLRYDRVFKAVFVDASKNDHHLLEALLEECLECRVKILEILYAELSVRNKLERNKRLDCIIDANGQKINLELNSSFNEITKYRNFNFFNSFYSQHTKTGNKYDLETKFIQINLNFDESKDYIKKGYMIMDEEKIEYIKNYQIINFNVDKIFKKWYHSNMKGIEKYTLLTTLSMNEDELIEYSEAINNEYVKEVSKKVMSLNSDPKFVYELTPEEDARYIHNTELYYAKKEGIKEGNISGEKNARIETVKTMLNKKYNIGEISDITKLSIEEIKKIQEEMQFEK